MSSLELADGTAFTQIAARPGARDIQPVPARTAAAPARPARRLRAAVVLLLDVALFLCLSVALVLATLLTPWRWSRKRPWKTKARPDSPPDWM